MAERETFEQFMARRTEFAPVDGERMSSVYNKQHRAFITYVEEQTADLSHLVAYPNAAKAILGM